ncbi:hypothetical protein PIB30_059430 [Stylosanthes scabra]|uniref:Uncharacterized protein n=1 Tax=Stylosanthes scabra TaxID=79078 RepID=A0ABU6TK21_9FABA|nr:hypothetical protein [Stylosanthes scabra]
MSTMKKKNTWSSRIGCRRRRNSCPGKFLYTPCWKCCRYYLRVLKNHYELKIRELLKSLTGKVFTQYAELRVNRINTWGRLVMEFCKQVPGRGTLHAHREICMDTLPKPQSVYKGVRNVEDGSQIFLFMRSVNIFPNP